ncbi:MAG: polysaccharide deacetylase family protein [Bacillota bacterium]|nr:polysaccharide deacetylase family protein [Bacillota bacterium]
MKKLKLISIFCVVFALSVLVCLTCLYFYYNSLSKPASIQQDIAVNRNPVFKENVISSTQQGSTYQIFCPITGNEQVDSILNSYVKDTLNGFLTKVEKLKDKNLLKKLFGTNEKNRLICDYDVLRHDDEIISIRFNLTFSMLNSTPEKVHKEFVFNAKTGDPLPISYFFPSTSDYLNAISQASAKELKIKHPELTDDKIVSLTKPVKESFSDYLVNDSAFLIYFENFQDPISIPFKSLSCETIYTLLPPKPIKTVKLPPKPIALTFDDGPNPATTKRLLDGLSKRGVKVTFFVLGNRVEQNQKLIKRMYDEGHLIGNHGYDHSDYTRLSAEDQNYEFYHTNELIQGITGESVLFMRPSYGKCSEKLMENIRMCAVLWDVDPEDWKYKDAKKVANHIVTHAHKGDIIILHDIYKTSVDAALIAIDELEARGYSFVRVDDLLTTDAGYPQPGTIHYSEKN